MPCKVHAYVTSTVIKKDKKIKKYMNQPLTNILWAKDCYGQMTFLRKISIFLEKTFYIVNIKLLYNIE